MDNGQAIKKFVPPSHSEGAFPDSGKFNGKARYVGGFGVRSQSSKRIYKICFDLAGLCWVCDCAGSIAHGQCKHLTAAGLKGRRYGKDINEAKKYGWIS